jgi:hypothetical protein
MPKPNSVSYPIAAIKIKSLYVPDLIKTIIKVIEWQIQKHHDIITLK